MAAPGSPGGFSSLSVSAMDHAEGLVVILLAAISYINLFVLSS